MSVPMFERGCELHNYVVQREVGTDPNAPTLPCPWPGCGIREGSSIEIQLPADNTSHGDLDQTPEQIEVKVRRFNREIYHIPSGLGGAVLAFVWREVIDEGETDNEPQERATNGQ